MKTLSCQLVYLPPYSPDLNRIEKCWATLKSYLS
ncbi:transposase [Nostoc sp.]